MSVIHKLEVNKEGTRLYAAVERTVQLYNLENGEVISSYTFEDDQPKSKSQQGSPDGAHVDNLTLTEDEKHLISTVNEGKYALVLDSTDLSLVSKRSFPKRPSAVDSTKDNEKLVLADKFGDVYGVPLTGTDAVLTEGTEDSKIEPILGHVSMLVDIKAAQKDNGKQYIITADRDEHIRVTRYPQTYVIEHWLFGHTEFVSVIETLPWNPHQLVSAGGDDFVAHWDWTTGELLQTFDIRPLVEQYLNESHNPVKRSDSKREITVSHLIPINNQLFVLCENVSCLLQLQFDSNSKLSHLSTFTLDHPIISAAACKNTLYIAVENTESPLITAKITPDGISKSENQLTPALPGSTNPVPLYNLKQLRKRGEF
jgi:tRNA (guanine-N(7)-)-methyltransferase subunit TRM82